MSSQVMARPLRVEFEGALYRLIGRGNAGQRIFFVPTRVAPGFVELLVQVTGTVRCGVARLCINERSFSSNCGDQLGRIRDR